jgi:hypothetical protein
MFAKVGVRATLKIEGAPRMIDCRVGSLPRSGELFYLDDPPDDFEFDGVELRCRVKDVVWYCGVHDCENVEDEVVAAPFIRLTVENES